MAKAKKVDPAPGTEAVAPEDSGQARGPAPETAAPVLRATHIRVAARYRDGFRRCGRAWSLTPVDVQINEFSAGEIERLLNDPALVADILCDDDGAA
ncbi:MAG: hypothetical protein LBF61_02750 [Azoarcus sp.]|jgi:hypothetical protein|nr:hypothetical protein [Azoarcus sp.]